MPPTIAQTDLARYQRAIAEARLVGLRLMDSQQRDLLRLLQAFLRELTRDVGRFTEAGDLIAARAVLLRLVRELRRDVERATRTGVELTARRMEVLHSRASYELVRFTTDAAQAERIAAVFQGIGTASAQAVLARPELAAAIQSLRADCVAAADKAIREAILRGHGSQELSKALRGMVNDPRPGAPGDAALRVRRRADLIARTEIANAEQEAAAQLAAESPLVAAVRWRTSNRHPEHDECDGFAELNLYGLGPGVFPSQRLPARPHPRCLCTRTHVILDPEFWGRPKEAPAPLVVDADDLIDGFELAPSRARAMRQALVVAEQRGKG